MGERGDCVLFTQKRLFTRLITEKNPDDLAKIQFLTKNTHIIFTHEICGLGLSGLLGLAVLMYPASHRLNIPYTVLLAATGCLLGYSAEWGIDLQHLGIIRDFLGSLNSFSISSDAVLFIFLPVLVFEAALGIDAHRLIDDIAPILLLAVIGLLISAFMVGYTLHWVSGVSLIVCLLLGAIVSGDRPRCSDGNFQRASGSQKIIGACRRGKPF